jgi:hypothetical protein
MDEKSSSAMAGGIGTNVILSVGEKKPPEGYIGEFTNPLIITGNSVPFMISLQNAGETVILPAGTIKIKDMFGRQAGNITLLPQHVLGNSKRYMAGEKHENQSLSKEGIPQVVLKEEFLFGLYSAEALVELEKGGKVVSAKTTFIALPFYLIFALSFFTFLGLSIFFRVKRKIKK